MLWYKAWLETRSRFLTCLATLTIFCAVFVHHALSIMNEDRAVTRFETDYRFLLFVTQEYVVILWILGAILLGMGGLVREKAVGTSSLTLSLPVSRTYLMGVRVGMGVLQAIALGVAPWLAIYLVSSLGRMPVLVAQDGFYLLLLVGGGLVYFAMAVLVSSLVEGEYTAPALAYGLVFLGAILGDAWLRDFNLWRLVTGAYCLDRKTYLLSGHFPWLGILASLSVAALMLLASVKVIQRREF
ncbi:MAG: ABC transporter permease subunit [Terriglobia bacterium]